jgi:hypothetical protein
MKMIFIRWTLIGLLIRFLIMPFSFHGEDIFFIYYAPFKFIEQGAWDPYLFLKSNFPQIYNPYYPPLAFFINSIFLFLFKPLLPSLHNLFSLYESRAFAWQGNTIHYADVLTGHQLFRSLFIFKIPYLIFDFGTAWFLYQILKPDKRKSLLSYKIWLLNPFVLHSCYALGQFEIMIAFFMMASIYCIYLNRKYFAMLLLTCGFLTKTFPIILVPFAILLSGNTFKEWFKLSLIVMISLIIFIAPFYLSSNNAIFEALFFSHGGVYFLRLIFFIVSYLVLICLLFFRKKGEHIDLDLIILSFISGLLLFYAFYTVTLRFFVLITPLLIYVAFKNKRFWIYNIIFLVALFILRTCGNSQQWGLFAALHPEFFSSLPIADSYINLIINVKYIHQFMYRLFFISSLTMVFHILLANKNIFKLPLPIGVKNEKK